MHGKMRSFFEDTGIILVLAGIIYGGYYLYTSFPNDNNVISSTIEIQKKVVIKKDKIIIDDNKSTVIENKIISDDNKSIIIKKVDLIKLQKDIIIQEPEQQEEPILPEVKNKAEKNVDVNALRIFLRSIKFTIARNIVKRDDVNETISQNLKIRITVLKDGTYEELKFLSGDQKLFEMNKMNILKIFPLTITDNIKDEFPRYIRISTK